ncbi:MAG: hypothetical protein HKN13_07945 [Rhodothermales bacterium]|nr:hypothetical protein [Rhodothermales bacterium]
MTLLKSLERSILYDQWANGEIIRCVAGMNNVPERILSVVSHLIAAQRLWLDRLHGDEQSMEVWPEMTIDEVKAGIADVTSSWSLFMDNQREEKLLRPIAYKNSQGAPWANRVEEIIQHACLHSAYHRGQIAMLLREEGVDPPPTDFIHAVRSGMLG